MASDEQRIAANRQEPIGYWVKTTDRLARRVDELEAALETLAHWPLEKTRFEAEKFAKEALRRDRN